MFVPSKQQRQIWNRQSYLNRTLNMGRRRIPFPKPVWAIGEYGTREWFDSNNDHAWDELRRIRRAILIEEGWETLGTRAGVRTLS